MYGSKNISARGTIDEVDENSYIGQELELFATAVNWKEYLRRQIQPWLGAQVLEVGAGIGATTRFLFPPSSRRWVCLEPDSAMAQHLQESINTGELPGKCEVMIGSVADVASPELFDSILYIDVLEHIEDDAAEVRRVAEHLNPGGRLIILSPAHQCLYTEFDRSIGHFRRYNARMIKALTPNTLTLERLRYLDVVGTCASLANVVLLRQSMPSERQILVWDRLMVPISRWIDPLFAYSLGKSILAVWTRPADD